MTPSLLGRLVRVQAWVVTLSCSVLVVGVLLASALVLRSTQDTTLRSVHQELCRGIFYEMAEHRMNQVDASREFFLEARMERLRYELLDPGGRVLAWTGANADLPVVPGRRGCASVGSEAGGRWRSCVDACAEAPLVLRVSQADALATPETRTVILILLALLPLGALVGTLTGRAVFRRALSPLHALETAAAAGQPTPGLTLGVGACERELASLEQAFDGLLGRLGEALERERRFAQEASHELRTPLTVLRVHVERARASLASGSASHELDAALEEVRRIDQLVESLLLLARSEEAGIPMTPVNLCDVARDAARARSRIDGEASSPPEVLASDEILVRGSEDLLGRVLDNLLENARKFAGVQAIVRIHVSEDGDGVLLRVEDDGPGMEPEHRPRAFERFFRSPTDRSRVPGTGLGLAVAQAIVRRHGGSMSTGPSALGGEEVRMRLPRYGDRHQ